MQKRDNKEFYDITKIANPDLYFYSTIHSNLFSDKQKLPTFLIEGLSRFLIGYPEYRQGLTDVRNFNDPLVSLILENAAIHAMFHRLTIKIIEHSIKENNIFFENGKYISSGSFLPSTGTIIIYLSDSPPLLDSFLTVLMHELTHAVTFYLFKPGKELEPPTAPYPFKDRYLYSKSYEEKHFNPAELKFKHCVRKDLENFKNFKTPEDIIPQHIKDDYLQLSSETQTHLHVCLYEILKSFEHIGEVYQSSIFEKKGMAEIFPQYMEYRLELLLLSKKHHFKSEFALNILKNAFPNLTDYFETDVKRILKHSLLFYIDRYSLYERYSFFSGKENPYNELNNNICKEDLDKLIRGYDRKHLVDLFKYRKNF